MRKPAENQKKVAKKVERKLPERCQKVIRNADKKNARRLPESCEKVAKKSPERCQKVTTGHGPRAKDGHMTMACPSGQGHMAICIYMEICHMAMVS